MEVLRATEEWQRTGAYYVRIQAMVQKHHITLREEFDEHDGNDAKYIVLLDCDFPVATCRWFPISEDTVEIGRVVVLPDYRGKGIGTMLVNEAEKWIVELGYRKIVIGARTGKQGFYEKLGFTAFPDIPVDCTTFECVHMEKQLNEVIDEMRH